jgi:hypothetical protein
MTCIVAWIMWSDGRLKMPDVPGSRFIGAHRWWLLAAASIVVIVVRVTVEQRRKCPACGKRGFTRVLSANWWVEQRYRETMPRYWVRYCESCGIREVYCERGVARLPDQDWEAVADRYARYDDDASTTPKCYACGHDLAAMGDRCPACGAIGNPLRKTTAG